MAKKDPTDQRINRFWFASTSGDQGREQTLKLLRKSAKGLADVHVLDVPQSLKFGSFDDLIRLLDDITKQENSLDSVLKRVQRQALELSPDAKFDVTSMRQTMTADEYISRFTWDDARFPKNRNVVDILDSIIQQVMRLDEDIKAKMQSYNETKQSAQALQNKVDASLHQRDLVDVFGEEGEADQLIETENIVTVALVVPKLQEVAFLKCYESYEGVVPTSAYCHKKAADKDGNQLYTVVLMRRNKDAFTTPMRKMKCMHKEYTHVDSAHDDRKKQRAELMAEKQRQEQYLTRVCVASFSDIFMAIVHLKALKIFVDSVLRMGVPIHFCAYSFFPVAGAKQQTKLWNEMIRSLSSGDAEQYKEDNYNPFAFADFQPYV
eukprot:GHVH01000153.1.p1 GENE.GHVH01000153.1~~GHVH01000153.1.p1  ORF type:complete len:378 (+),score=67.06 GHVH01000153.1:94-1227(+)